jgi:hypothetical protein
LPIALTAWATSSSRAARFSDRQGGGEAVERRLELALVEMRAGDATDDR